MLDRIRNIHCLALNYKGVGDYRQEPLYFLKSTSCLSYGGSIIPYPKRVGKMWTEVELGILVKHDGENIHEEDAHEFIGGFFIAGDITVENVWNRDHHLAFSKARTGFCPIQCNVREYDFKNWPPLMMSTWINGRMTQVGYTDHMIFNPYESLSYISRLVRLQKNDIILTGTPFGAQNNIVKPGDQVEHRIEKLGSLEYKFSL